MSSILLSSEEYVRPATQRRARSRSGVERFFTEHYSNFKQDMQAIGVDLQEGWERNRKTHFITSTLFTTTALLAPIPLHYILKPYHLSVSNENWIDIAGCGGSALFGMVATLVTACLDHIESKRPLPPENTNQPDGPTL